MTDPNGTTGQAPDGISPATLTAFLAASEAPRPGVLKDMPARVADSGRAHVRDHPLATIGLAVAAGFALSWLMRSR